MIKLTVLQISSGQQQIICIKLVHLKTVICKRWQTKWTQHLEEQNHFQIKKKCQEVTLLMPGHTGTIKYEKKRSCARVPLPWWKSNVLIPKSGHYVRLSTRTGERNGGWNIWTGEVLRCWRWSGHNIIIRIYRWRYAHQKNDEKNDRKSTPHQSMRLSTFTNIEKFAPSNYYLQLWIACTLK